MSRKPMEMRTARTFTVQCSDFLNTFQRQYMNAPIHRHHSRSAASITKPTMAV